MEVTDDIEVVKAFQRQTLIAQRRSEKDVILEAMTVHPLDLSTEFPRRATHLGAADDYVNRRQSYQRVLTQMRSNKDTFLPELRSVLRSNHGSFDRGRVIAILILCDLGELRGQWELRDLLEQGDSRLRAEVLSMMTIVHDFEMIPEVLETIVKCCARDESAHVRRFLLRHLSMLKGKNSELEIEPEAGSALSSLLEDSDPELRREAIWVTNTDADGLGRIAECLHDSSRQVQVAAILRLSRDAPSPEALDKLEELGKRSAHAQVTLRGLAQFFCASDPILRERAIAILEERTRRCVADSLNDWTLIEMTARTTPSATTAAQAILNSLRRELLHLLEDSRLRHVAIGALAFAAEESEDAEVVETLRHLKEEPTISPAYLANALLSVGGQTAREVAQELLDRVHGSQRLDLLWRLQNLDLAGVTQKLVDWGLIKPVEDAWWKRHEELTRRGGATLLKRLLCEQGTAIRASAAARDLNYRAALERMSKVSRSEFKPEALAPIRDWQHLDLGVEFVSAGKRYQFLPRRSGWAGLRRVVNQCLEDSGAERRFIAYDDLYVYARPALWQKVAAELPLSP